MTRTISLLFSLALLLSWTPKQALAQQPEQKAAPVQYQSLPNPTQISKSVPLHPSDRVFTVTLRGNPASHILGADRESLWFGLPWQRKPLWKIRGPGGVVQKVILADLGQGERLYVVWGMGRGARHAPLTLQELVPYSGQGRTLWSFQGPRNEVAHLGAHDLDGDGKAELSFAHYVDKYHVKTRHLKADGSLIEGAPLRMANTRDYGDLNGDQRVDEAIGRVYGDARGEVGDLRVIWGGGKSQLLSCEDGVRALQIGQAGGIFGLFFSDGWLSDYGRKARAQLKVAIWKEGSFEIQEVGRSPTDFSFFDFELRDLDGDAQAEIIARGNKSITLFQRKEGRWNAQKLADLSPILNMAPGRRRGGWNLYLPARPHTRVIPLSLP